MSEIRIECAEWTRVRTSATMIRTTVFVEEQGVPAELEIDDDDPVSVHALAYRAAQPVGTARLLPDGHIGRMAVLAAFRGQGVGRALLMRLIHIARVRGDRSIVLNAQTQAIAFYARCGFVMDSGEFLEAGIPHRRMRWLGPTSGER